MTNGVVRWSLLLLVVLVFALPVAGAAAQPQSDVPSPDGYVTNGQVNAVGFDSAGRAYLGGTFTSVGPRTGHAAELSTTSDQPAAGFPDVDGNIRAVASDGSGGWFIGGDFSTVGGVPRARLAHIDSSGAVDGWNPGADGRVNALAVTAAAVYVGGEFGTVGGQSHPFMARVAKASPGDVTTGWNALANGRVTALTSDANGIYVGGDFTQIAGESRNRLARLNDATTAGADLSWDPDVDGNVAAIAASAGGVYIGGSFTHVGGTALDRLAKIDVGTGVPDAAWHPGATGGTVSALALSGSDLYVGGSFTSVDSQPRSRIAKIDAGTGTVALGWSPSVNNTVLGLAATATDVYVAGDFTQVVADTRNRLAKLAASDGSVDTWNPNANATARAIAVSGTDVFAGGDFTSVGGQARNRLARIGTDGSVDAWNPGADNTVSALVVSDSDVYVGGSFLNVGGASRAKIAKLSTSSDAADATWHPDASGTVSALAVSGTDVYAGGLFTTIDGQPRARIAKLTGASGTADPGWHPDATTAPPGTAQVSALAISGSDVYAGGSFTTIDAQPRNRIARLSTSDGTADTWDPDADGTVSTLVVSGTDVYAGGSFSSIGGQARNFIAKLATSSGDADPTWDPAANSVVRAIALSSSDVYIAGGFTTVSGQTHGRIAKLPQDGTGVADAGWDPGVANNTGLALAVQGDRLAAGGSFTAVGGQSISGFALFDLPALSPSPGGLDFGNREVNSGASTEQTSVVTNNGSQTVHITAVTLGGPDAGQFSRVADAPPSTDCNAGTDLAPGGHCDVRATFSPTTAGAKSAEITIDSDFPGVRVALSGVGAESALSPDPASLAFGFQDRDAGATTERSSTVTNNGTQTVTLSSVTVGGTDSTDFVRRGDDPLDCRGPSQDDGFTATQLLPNQSCNVRVAFDPSNVDGRSAKVTLTPSVGNPVDIGLSGTGTLTQISRAPDSLHFMNQDIDGTSDPQTSVVHNDGTEPVTISGVSIPGSDFSRATGQPNDCTDNEELARNASCDVRVVFHPGTPGAKSGTATISSSTPGVDDLTVSLDGTGTQTELTPASATKTFDTQELAAPPSTTKTATFTNTGTELVTVTDAAVSGDSGDFVHLTDQPTDCKAGKEVPATQSCEVRLQFDPANRGLRQATVTVSSNAADVVVNASGTGIETRLSATPDSHDFMKQDIDETPASYFESTVKNEGDQAVDITGVTSSDQAHFPVVNDGPTDNCTAVTHLEPNDTCKVRIKFDPTDTGHQTATITVASNAPDVTIGGQGDGTQTALSTDNASFNFGNQFTGAGPTTEKMATITNSGTETVNFIGVTQDGDASQFPRDASATTDCKPTTTLASGGTCNVRVTFDPDSTGDKASTVHVTSNAAEVTIALTGHGTLAQLGRSQATLAFGDRDVDEPDPSTPQSSTITNTGNVDVTISTVSFDPGGTDPGAFARATGDSGDCVDGQVLHPTDHCTVRATFHPTAVGSKSASLTVHSNAADVTVSLTGRGTQTAWSRDTASLVFGKQDIDDHATDAQAVTVHNDGTEPIAISGVASNDSQFQLDTGPGTDCSEISSLAGGASCTVLVKFDPGSVGSKSGTVTISTTTGGISNLSFDVGGEGIQTAWSLDSSSIAFGKQDIDDNATDPHAATVTNDGTEPIAITGVASNDDQFQLDTGPGTDCSEISSLAGGTSCTVLVKFDPGAVGSKSGTVTISTTTGGLANLTLSVGGQGTQTELSRSVDTFAFGNKGVGDGATGAKTSVVTNSGTEDVTLGTIDVSAEFVHASGSPGDCMTGTLLHAGDTCNLRIRFDPSSTGPKTGTATVHSNAADVSVALSGAGIATDLSPSPDALAFGKRDIDEGPTGVLSTTVTNAGPDEVIVGAPSITGANAGDFERLLNQLGDCAVDRTLAPGDTCDVRVRFDPSATGARSATLNVPAANGGATATVALTGTGTQTGVARDVSSISAGSRDIDDGATTPQAATISNTGTEDVTVTSVDVTGEFSQATPQAGDCGAGTVLHGGDTCALRVQFDPSSVGTKTGTAAAHTTAGDLSVALDGVGTQTSIKSEPTAIDYGLQDVASNLTPKESTVTNTGTEPVTLTDIGLSGPSSSEFLRVSGLPTDCAVGATLNANDTCKLRARFVPQTAGAKSATLTLTSSAGVATVVLSGTARPLLRIPSFGAKASSTRKRSLTVPINPVGGTVRSIVVQVRSGTGKLLGTGTRASASRRNTVTVNLRTPLKRGFYRATARGRDALGNVVTASRRSFRLR